MAKKRGRPSLYTPDLAAEICIRIVLGDSLRKICADAKMPAIRTVMYWLAGRGALEEFVQQYARARAAQAELYADDIIEIADDDKDDDIGDPVMSLARLARHRLRIDARKWTVSKLLPRYADRLVHEGGEKPIGITPVPLNDRELARRIALILSRADPKKGKE